MEIKGYVEHHNENGIGGWCVHLDEELRSNPVQLQLFLGDLLLREGYTNRARGDIKRGYGVEEAGFYFHIAPDLIELLPEGSVLSVKVASGPELPQLNTDNVAAIGTDTNNGETLKDRLAKGWHVNQWGNVKVAFGVDPERKQRHIKSMSLVSEFFNQRYGLPMFPAYGTLLGYERNGRLLDHDDDVDTSYISRQQSLEGVAAEFWNIARDIKALGHTINVVATGHCHVALKDTYLPAVDIFTGWVSTDNTFYCYPRIGEPAPEHIMFKTIELEGANFIAPEPAEAFVEMMYGKNWKVPDTGWQSVVPAKVRKTMEALRVLSEDI